MTAPPNSEPRATPAPFDWRAAIGFGLGVLRLSPDAFWRMTPRELAFAIEAVTGRAAASIERPAFIALMRRFPDAARRGHQTHSAGNDHG
jgi:uncharacterized phage protein (TIGR02216 family)